VEKMNKRGQKGPAAPILSLAGSGADRARILRSWRLIAREDLPLSAKLLYDAVHSHTTNGRTAAIEERELLSRITVVEEVLIAKGEITPEDVARDRIMNARRDAAPLVADLWRLSGVGAEAVGSTTAFLARPARDRGRAMAFAWQLVNEWCADQSFARRLVRGVQLVLLAVGDYAEHDEEASGDRITTAFCSWLEEHEEALLSPAEADEFFALKREVAALR
jgi:hypothetical protein